MLPVSADEKPPTASVNVLTNKYLPDRKGGRTFGWGCKRDTHS